MANDIVINVIGKSDLKEIDKLRAELKKIAPDVETAMKATAASLSVADKGLADVGKAADTAGKHLDGLGKKGGGLIDTLGKIGLAGLGIGAIVGVAGKVAGEMGDVIGKAEELGDAQAKLGLSLGNSTDRVTEFLDVANGLGMTKTQFLETAASIGQLATSLGVSQDKAAGMAENLTELGPQLAAYAGVEKEVAGDALQNALLGKTKGLAALGIAITDADVAAAAMREGIKGEKKDWTEAQLATVMYAAAMDKTKVASDAWADNQGDVEVSMQRVSAAMDDAKATIGEKLLPAIAPLMEALADHLPAAMDLVTKGIDLIGKGWDELVKLVGPIIDKVKELAASFGKGGAGGAMEKLQSAMIPLMDLFKKLQPVIDTAIAGVMSVLSKVDFERITALFSAAFDRVMDVVRIVVNFFRDNWGAIGPIVMSAIKVVTTVLGTLVDLVMDVVGVITKLLQGDFSGAWDAAKEAVSHLVENVGKIFDSWLEYMRGLIPLVLKIVTDIGKSIVDGIKSGISGMWESFMTWVHDQIMKIPKAVRDLLGIKSPSTVFAEIGRSLVEGLSVGVAGAIPAALGQAEDFARQWLDHFANYLQANSEEARQQAGTLMNLIYGEPSAGLFWGTKKGGNKIWDDAQKGASEYYGTVLKLADDLGKIEDPVAKQKKYEELYKALESWEKHRHDIAADGIKMNTGMSEATKDALNAAEDIRHEKFMENLAIEGLAIADLKAAQEKADADRLQAIADRKAAIEAERDAALDFATQVHDQALAMLATEQEARSAAHDERLAEYDDEQDQQDYFHDARLAAIDAQVKAEDEAAKRRTSALAEAKRAADAYVKALDLSGAQAALSALQSKASAIRSLLGGFEEVDPDPRKQAAKDRERANARVRLVSDEQREAVRAALAAGKIVDAELRRQAQLWAQGATIRQTDAEKIADMLGDSLDAEAARQGAVVTGIEAEIAARQGVVDKAQELYDAEDVAATARRVALAAAKTQEDAFYAGVSAQIETKRKAENNSFRVYSEQMAAQVKEADAAHARLLAQIQEEAAVRLLAVGVTAEEAARLLEEQRRRAAEIAAYALKVYTEAMAGLGGVGEVVRGIIRDIEEPLEKVADWTGVVATNLSAAATSGEVLRQVFLGIDTAIGAAVAMVQDFQQSQSGGQRARSRPGQTTTRGRGGFRFTGLSIGDDNTTMPSAPMGPGAYTIAARSVAMSAGDVTIAPATVTLPNLRAEVTVNTRPQVVLDGRIIDALVDVLERKMAEKFVMLPGHP